jgi:hypothetical protein
MKFFANEIRNEQFKQCGRRTQSPIETLIKLYTNKSMITLSSGETVLHFEYLVKLWCSDQTYILYEKTKRRNTFILSWNYHLNKYEHPIRNLNSDVMGVICSFL